MISYYYYILTCSRDLAVYGVELVEHGVVLVPVLLDDPVGLAEAGVDALAALVHERGGLVHHAVERAALDAVLQKGDEANHDSATKTERAMLCLKL